MASPLINLLGNKVSSTLSSATSYAVSSVTSKVSEAATSVIGTLGGVGNFTKIASTSKSFVQMSAEAQMQGQVTSALGLTGLAASTIGSTEASATASQVKAATGASSPSLHKVTLKETGTTNMVVFDIMPEIAETHTVEYESVAPPQFPGAFQKYKGNSSTQWTLNISFVSRTTAEATRNYDYLMMLRGWTKPFYGDRTGAKFAGKLGAPPPVLQLRGLRDLIGPVPVVIVSLNWTWQKDLDYIATSHIGPDGKPVPFPAVLSVPIQLVESYSVTQFNEFSLNDFRSGNLGPAFNIVSDDAVSSSGVGMNDQAVNEFGMTPAEQLQYLRDNTIIR
jgi:hypothetical protein